MSAIELDTSFIHNDGVFSPDRSFLQKRGELFEQKFPYEKKLSGTELFELTDKLSDWREPERKFMFGGIDIRVFRLTKRPDERELGKSTFRSELDQRLLVEGRKSYNIYGNVPLLDDYDKEKAHSYYIQFTSTQKTGARHRAGTFLRYVPYVGIPFSNEDFDHYVVDMPSQSRVPLIKALKETTEDYKIGKRLVTQSRLCSLNFMEGSYINGHYNNEHLSLGFAAASLQFFKDTEMEGAIITGQLHDKLVKKLNYEGYELPFTPAATMLGVDKSAVYMNWRERETQEHRLKYLGYCLDIPSVVNILDELIAKSEINESLLSRYLPEKKSWSVVRERKSMSDWARIGEILSNREVKLGNNFTSWDLRERLQEVADGPVLRIMHQDHFLAGCQEMLEFARFNEESKM